MIARVILNEDYQPNILIPNFDNEKKLAQKELESEVFAQTIVMANFLRTRCTQFNCKWLG